MSESGSGSNSKDKHADNMRHNLCTHFKPKAVERFHQYRRYKEILKTRLYPVLQEQRLLLAVTTNNTKRVQTLLQQGVSANSADRQSRSALHLAASRGYVDIVRLLLAYGADPNRRDVIQNTPLHLAACLNNLEIVTMLLKAGADAKSIDIYGRNPLQVAKSKLQLLQKGWKEGAIEMVQLKSQLQMIVDVIISMWHQKENGKWGNHRDNVDDLQFMKLSLDGTSTDNVDDQMSTLLDELQNFSIK